MADGVALDLRDLLDAVGGRLLGARRSDFPVPTGIEAATVDSRKIPPRSIFAPLKGERVDGHDFIVQALRSGAVASFVSSERAESDGAALAAAAKELGAALVVVDDVLRALQAAAGAYLDLFPGLIRVGITGSAGKTTVKELAGAMVGAERSCYFNPGNLNSDSGLPLAAFGVRPEHEVAIFEMGMNRRGEIAELAGIVRPRIALVTNVGTAHIGILGSKDAIAEEKRSIFRFMDDDGVALYPEDDAYAAFLAEGLGERAVPWGPRSLGAFGGATDRGLDGTELVWGGVPALLPLPGRHNLANALAAAAIAETLGVSPEAVRSGIAGATPLFGRGEVLRGELTVLRDCYNANPEAVEAAVDFCDGVTWPGRRVYVIGEMRELGDESDERHRALGARLAASKADLVFLFGEGTAPAEAAIGTAKRTFRSADIVALGDSLSRELRRGDLVLLKGSRDTALERLSDRLVPSEGER